MRGVSQYGFWQKNQEDKEIFELQRGQGSFKLTN